MPTTKNEPPRHKVILSIPKDVDMWSDSQKAADNRENARKIVREVQAVILKNVIPEGWSVEYHG